MPGPIVNAKHGALRGSVLQAINGGKYFGFLGIPYAQPPVGNLRFKAPEPVKAWTGIRDATQTGQPCAQIDMIMMTGIYVGEEDCLYINVYTPKLPGSSKNETKTPVMVWVHGGGFMCGSGDPDMYGPDFLINEGVVLVTFNYRLGPLGFLTTEDAEIPGNAGLKDQVAALKWVQQNISSFGGDPGNVTIFGESAGGASVHYLLLSSLTRGLFHRAISQSGSALNNWAVTSSGRKRTLCLAHALGCKSDNSKEVLAFLRKVPVQELVEKQTLAVSTEEDRRTKNLALPFVPIFDGAFEHSEEVFLHKPAIDIIKSGKFNKVPYITGVNSNEGILFIKAAADQPEMLAKLDNDFQGFLPEDLFPILETTQAIQAANKVKSFYFQRKPLCKDTLNEYALLLGDTMFVEKVNKTVKLHSQHVSTSAPLYYYQFAYDGPLGALKTAFGLSALPGVSHGDDLGYLFSMKIIEQDNNPNVPGMNVRALLLKLWTNFAKNGKPDTPGVTWTPVTSGKNCLLKIDKTSTMQEEMEPDRMHFWDELYQSANLPLSKV